MLLFRCCRKDGSAAGPRGQCSRRGGFTKQGGDAGKGFSPMLELTCLQKLLPQLSANPLSCLLPPLDGLLFSLTPPALLIPLASCLL